MAKTVLQGHGVLVSGGCPKCPERISVFLREHETYKNTRCTFCGADVHGDGISGIIRDGHYDLKVDGHPAEIKVEEYTLKEDSNNAPSHMEELAEYEKGRRTHSRTRRHHHHIIRRLPAWIGKKV